MEPFLLRNVGCDMVMIFLVALAGTYFDADDALKRCRPVLARKAGGEINSIAVDRSQVGGRAVTISGHLTAFLGMGPPPSGSASAHHLIRADFDYRCTVLGHSVGSATVRPRR